MKLGKVKVKEPGFHPVYRKLEYGQVLELPDSWDFSKETLCDPVDDAKQKKIKINDQTS